MTAALSGWHIEVEDMTGGGVELEVAQTISVEALHFFVSQNTAA